MNKIISHKSALNEPPIPLRAAIAMRRQRIKHRLLLLLAFVIICSVSGCKEQGEQRYYAELDGMFDTYISIIAYTDSQQSFDKFAGYFYNRTEELHRLFDIYHEYEGLNNLCTVNNNAGITPVAVAPEIISLLQYAVEVYALSEGSVNVMLGPVLKIWHNYREEGLENPESAKLPSMNELLAARQLTDIDGLAMDKTAGTVYLEREGMSLDVGSLAKGFACQLVGDELKQMGIDSFLINMGGNVLSTGGPKDGKRESWSVGVENPRGLVPSGDEYMATLYVNEASIVTSGDYQRYYTVDSTTYCHIIDPETLMPANRYSAVTVVTGRSELGDFLSTALFVLPYEQGRLLAERFGCDAIWVYPDGTTKETGGFSMLRQ